MFLITATAESSSVSIVKHDCGEGPLETINLHNQNVIKACDIFYIFTLQLDPRRDTRHTGSSNAPGRTSNAVRDSTRLGYIVCLNCDL